MPISDCEVRDPRIRRTRQSLQSALATLLGRKSFEEISVQDIADEAAVNRATFYDHYSDKFQMLDAMVAGGFHKLLHERQIEYDGTCPGAIQAIVQATCDYLAQVHDWHRNHSAQDGYGRLIDSAITNAISLSLLRGAKHLRSIGSGNGAEQLPPEVMLNAVSWAIYGAVRQWYSTPDRTPAVIAVPQIMQLVLPMLLITEQPLATAGTLSNA